MLSFTLPCGSNPRPCNQGAAALLVVMGISIALLLAAVMVGAQSRQELRMAGAETTARKGQLAVTGAFAEVAAQAQDPDYAPNDDGTTWCIPSGAWPRTCTQVLVGRNLSIPAADWEQLPVRVVWQGDAGSDPQAFYGWVLRHRVEDTSQVPSVRYIDKIEIVYYHFWCPPGAIDPELGPCKLGG